MTRTAENEMTAITLDRSAVEQVLAALEEADLLMEHRQNVELRRSALVTLRAALEQPQVAQQPCLWLDPNFGDTWRKHEIARYGKPDGAIPLYTHPQPQPQVEQEPDWSNSKTLPSELWKSPLLSLQERLQIADGAVRWNREVADNLRSRLQQQSEPLTDEQIEKICPSFDDPMRSEMWKIGFKAAHKIKDNT